MNSSQRQLVVLAHLGFAILLLPNWHLQASSIPEIVAKTKPAIVEIVAMDEKGSPTTLRTGFFVSSDGLVVTNFHVVKGATSLSAINNNGAIFLLERVVAQPTGVDLAILKFRAKDVPFLHLGKSSTAVEGQEIIVIGNPTGLTGSVSDGIISAFREERTMIQITAPISPGSSGSPVMDEDGQVIGVATFQSVEGQNLNFAIAVEKVSTALAQPRSGQFSGQAVPTATPRPAIDPKVYFDSGAASFCRKDYDEAISDFTEAIQLDPNYAVAYNGRGIAHWQKGNFEKAFEDYIEAIQLDPNLAVAYYNRGVAYEHRGNFDKGLADYTEAIRLDSECVPAYQNRGVAYERSGKSEKAFEDFKEAIRLDPHSAGSYVGRGNVYYAQGNLDEAVRDYTEAIRLRPNFVLAYNNRGAAYEHKGNFDMAISDCTEAIRLDPNFAFAYNSRGAAYEHKGNFDMAISDCTEAIRLDPNCVQAYEHRGAAYLHIGKRAKANADIAAAERLKAKQ